MEFERILRFWFERGIAGFRIDVAHGLIKDRELRDEPDVADRMFSMNRPETHDILRGWRRLADSYDPERILVGEAYVLDVESWARFYGSGSDELNLAFNFGLVHSEFDAAPMRKIVAATEQALPAAAWPCWTGSNHDAGRFTTRWCGGDEARARAALLMLLTLRGTPFLYYGDELALAAGEVPPERVRDIAEPSRDPCRTPMPWTRQGGWQDPWLPLGDTTRNVDDQRADPSSTLSFTRDLIALRKRVDDLRGGSYEELPAPDGAWVWRRGENVVVAINLGGEHVEIDGVEGQVELSTTREREGESLDGAFRLDASEGVVVQRPKTK